MVMKNIQIIRIIVSILLMQTSLHAMRHTRVAALTKRHATHGQYSPKSVVQNNKRNQRTSSRVSTRSTAMQKKLAVNANAPVFKNNIQQNQQIFPQPVEQNSIKNAVVPPVQLKQEDTKKVDAVEPSVEKSTISKVVDTVAPKNKIDNSVRTNKAKDDFKSFVTKNKIDVGDPYANVEGLVGNNKSTQQKKEKFKRTEPEEITDLYAKRWQEFNASKKQLSQNHESREGQSTKHMIDKNDEYEIVIIPGHADDQTEAEKPFQFGQMFANGMNTVGNIFGGDENKIQTTENLLPKTDSLDDNSTDENSFENKENLNADSSKKTESTGTEPLQVGQLVANSTNAISNGLSAVWQYGKNGLTNAWNNCTSYDFWLKPYEQFSTKVLEQDPVTGKQVETIKGNVHAFLLTNIKEKNTADTIYYLNRVAMVILGMALFCNPSLIATSGVGQITTRLCAALMQLVTGGSLASVVTMVTGAGLAGLATATGSVAANSNAVAPNALAVQNATQQNKSTWASWAGGWIKSIGPTAVLNQIYKYKFHKDSVNEPSKNKPTTEPVVQKPASQNAGANSGTIIPNEQLQAQLDELKTDPNAQAAFVSLCLNLNKNLQNPHASQE